MLTDMLHGAAAKKVHQSDNQTVGCIIYDEVLLHMEMVVTKNKKAKKMLMLALVSPKSPGGEDWEELRGIREEVRLEEGK